MKKIKIKNEAIFAYFAKNNSCCCVSSISGKKQFFEKQSNGITPEKEDDYYKFLMRGKWIFDFLSSEYKKLYYSGEWWGWYMLWVDWKGSRLILKKLCSWHKRIPKWVHLEITKDELFDVYGV